MNKALIKVLQIVEGFSGSDVDGVFGNGTKQRLPRLSSGSTATDAIRLFHFLLDMQRISDFWNHMASGNNK